MLSKSLVSTSTGCHPKLFVNYINNSNYYLLFIQKFSSRIIRPELTDEDKKNLKKQFLERKDNNMPTVKDNINVLVTKFDKAWKKFRNVGGNSKFDLKGCHVAIAGGFGGIGRATCKALLKRGISSLGILDVKEDEHAVYNMRKHFPKQKIYYHPINVTKRDSVDRAFSIIKRNAKDLNVFINCSGVLDDTCPEQALKVNLLGTINTTLVAMEKMGRHNGGKGGIIVNVSSVLGLVPCNAFAIYSACQHGQVGFTRSLADDFFYSKTGVKLMSICPGLTETLFMHDSQKLTTFPFASMLANNFILANRQKPDVCGENLTRAIESNKNGSIWILDLGKYWEVSPIQYWKAQYGHSPSK